MALIVVYLKKAFTALLAFVAMFLFFLGSAYQVYAAPDPFGHSTFAIKDDGSLWGWGWEYSDDRQAFETREVQPLPAKILDNVAVIVSELAVHRHTAIKADGSLWAWGSNWNGALGDGTTEDRTIPVKIMDNVSSVSKESEHTMAIQTDGSLWAWGSNWNGVLGDGTTENRTIPVKIMDNVSSVSMGSGYTMAIQTDGSLWAWGSNWNGMLGDGTTEDRAIPVKIMDNVSSVSLGGSHTMAIQTDGSLWAWGSNRYGEIGDGTTINRNLPVKIMDDIVYAWPTHGRTTAVKTDGSLYAWGSNENGQLGDGTIINRYSPVRIMNGVTSVSMGFDYTMAVREDNSLWAWGANRHTYGASMDQHVSRLGDGTMLDRHSPTKIMDDIAAVSIGDGNNMAIKTDGSLWVWGNNFYGYSLADLDTYGHDMNVPVKVMDDVVMASTGTFSNTYCTRHFFTMALRSDGSLWAWGFNRHGQLGDGTNISRNTPIRIMDEVSAVSTSAIVSVLPEAQIQPTEPTQVDPADNVLSDPNGPNIFDPDEPQPTLRGDNDARRSEQEPTSSPEQIEADADSTTGFNPFDFWLEGIAVLSGIACLVLLIILKRKK